MRARPDRVALNLKAKPIGSTAEQRMLNASAPPAFLESAYEWRRLFSEAWGTFVVVVVGTMIGGAITLGMKVAAPGMMVMAIVYFMGAVGGAHLNPAVTLEPTRVGPPRRATSTSLEDRLPDN